MKLSEIIQKAMQEGYTHATDEYSYHPKKIKNIRTEEDNNEYKFENGEAVQIAEFPSNHYTFYKLGG